MFNVNFLDVNYFFFVMQKLLDDSFGDFYIWQNADVYNL